MLASGEWSLPSWATCFKNKPKSKSKKHHTCHPYLTLWNKISQNLAHLEAIPMRFIRPSYNTFLWRIKHTCKSHFVVFLTSFLHLNKGFWLFWGSSKVIFIKHLTEFYQISIKNCFISQISVHGLWRLYEIRPTTIFTHRNSARETAVLLKFSQIS